MPNNIIPFSEVVTNSLINLWDSVIGFAPELIGAFVILILGIIIAPIFGGIVKRLVKLTKIDTLSEKTGLSGTFENLGLRFTFSNIIGKLVKWFFLIAFLIAAMDVLNWTSVTDFLKEIMLYIPNVIVAIIILAVGLIAGQFVKKAVITGLKTTGSIKNSELLGNIARWSLVVFAALAALMQLGIAERLIEILFAGVIITLALSFGLGGKEKAARFLDRFDETR
ncbi:hypothetical protein IIA95_02245 [Patescibacteria group bacterium]|nr:hypothetical protein [Patescibacteria group bacterium]